MPAIINLADSPLALFLQDVAFRATAILAAAWCIALGLWICHRSAAARHLIWNLAVFAVLGLPLLTALLPPCEVSVPWPTSAAADGSAEGLSSASEASPILFADSTEYDQVSEAPLDSETENLTVDDRAGSAPLMLGRSTASGGFAMGRGSWLMLAWVIGFGMALLPVLLALASLAALQKRCQVVSSGRLYNILETMRQGLRLRRPVRLLLSDERAMPMTWGVWRSSIVLPAAALDWSPDRLRMVLRHELAHIERGDCATQMLAQLARAVYWFHPLVWLAERKLRVEQELACDDVVLRSGFAAPDYAEQLLAVASSCLPARALRVALAMARSAKFQGRLLAILGGDQDRRPVSRRGFQLAAVTTAAVVALASAVNVQSQVAVANEQAAVERTPKTEILETPTASADRAKTISELRSKIAAQYVTPVNDQEIVTGAIKGMLGALKDPYSDFLTPDSIAEMERHISGSLVGIGVQLETHEKQIRVVTPLAGSPALKAGIRPGDIITAIDDQPTAGQELSQVVKRVAGAAGTPVRLKIRRTDGQEAELNVIRGAINLPTVRGFRRGADNTWDFLLDADRKIGYLQIGHFGSSTLREVREAVESLKQRGVKGLILDLRFCPGGMLDSATGLAKLFLSEGTIVSLHARGQDPVTLAAKSGAQVADIPLIVLVNGQTASAAEVLAGALQDNKRGLVLGTRTHGKGTVQTLIKLDDGVGAVKLTTSEYHLPSGRSIDKRSGQATWGINPDEGYFVPLDRAQTKTLLRQQREREVIGGDKAAAETDPQTASALKTMSARLDRGAFEKVSSLSQREIDQFLQRDEIEQRRETALATLEQLDRELAALKHEQP